MIKAIENIEAGITKALLYLSYTMILVATLLIFGEIISRYVFNASHAWVSEASKYLLITMAFLLAGVCQSKKQHFTVDALVNKMKGNLKFSVTLIGEIIGLTAAVIAFVYAIPVVQGDVVNGTYTLALSFQMFWVTIPALLGGLGLLCLFYATDIIKLVWIKRAEGAPTAIQAKPE